MDKQQMNDLEIDRRKLQELKDSCTERINRLTSVKMPLRIQLNQMIKITTDFLEIFSGKEIATELSGKAKGIISKMDEIKYSGKTPDKAELDSVSNNLKSVISEIIKIQSEGMEKKMQIIRKKKGIISVIGGLLKPKEMNDVLGTIESLISQANAAILEGNVRKAKHIYNKVYILYMELETGLKRKVYTKVKELFEKLAYYQK